MASFDGDDGCNRVQLVQDMHLLYFITGACRGFFPISLGIFCKYRYYYYYYYYYY